MVEPHLVGKLVRHSRKLVDYTHAPTTNGVVKDGEWLPELEGKELQDGTGGPLSREHQALLVYLDRSWRGVGGGSCGVGAF